MSTMADEISEQNYREREQYNGYANRETWAFNLHWQNDQGLYNETLEVAREALAATEGSEPLTDGELGGVVVDYWGEELDRIHEQPNMPVPIRMFEREVGSWWRIDYAEVGAAVRESLSVEGE